MDVCSCSLLGEGFSVMSVTSSAISPSEVGIDDVVIFSPSEVGDVFVDCGMDGKVMGGDLSLPKISANLRMFSRVVSSTKGCNGNFFFDKRWMSFSPISNGISLNFTKVREFVNCVEDNVYWLCGVISESS